MAAIRIFRRLRELLDVSISAPTDGQVLTWVDADSRWENADATGGGGGGGAPTDATYIVQTADAGLSAEQALGDLASGLVKNTTSTGVLSIATAGSDYYAPGATDVAVADGGTGASTASAARSNLGLGTAATAATGDFDAAGAAAAAQAASQPLDSDLTALAGLDASTSGAIASDGAGWIKKTYAQFKTALGLVKADVGLGNVVNLDTSTTANITDSTDKRFVTDAELTVLGNTSGTNTGDQTLPTRASLGLDTTDSPQFAGVNIGAATDTTVTRTGAGDIAVEGNQVYRAGGTDVPVTDGGTGASDASGARTNLGLVIGTDVEAHDTDLTTIAGLTPTNDDVIQRKAGAWANRTMAQLIADLAALGTTFQPLDSDLTALAGLAIAADTLPYGSGSHTMSLATLTSFARTLLDDADAATARATLGVTASPTDGWTDDTANTWTYVSATSFKRSGVDETAKFSIGTRLRLKQGGAYKYFVVAAVTFSTDTTVTVTGGDDYSLANASITDNYFSYQANPQGSPWWFNFTCSATGFSSKSSDVGKFAVVGRTCFVWPTISGTSNAATFTWTLPIAAAEDVFLAALVGDNGSTNQGRLVTSGATVTLGKAIGGSGGFTTSGTKSHNLGMFTYGI